MLKPSRFLSFFFLLSGVFFVVGCAADEPMSMPTNTPKPSATFMIRVTETAVATATPTATPSITPIPLQLPSMTPFPTVTPDYDAPEPKPIFLFFGAVGGDGNPSLWRHSPSLVIYSDGTTIFWDKENTNKFLQTSLTPSEMCELKQGIENTEFSERSGSGEYYAEPLPGYGAPNIVVQFEETYYAFDSSNIQNLVDDLQPGFNQLANFHPPEPYEPYRPTQIALTVHNDGPDQDDVIELWPDHLPSIAELGLDAETDYELFKGELLLQLSDLFEGQLTSKFFKEGEQVYHIAYYPLLPHEITQTFGQFPRKPRDYVSLLDCKEEPAFISPTIPTVTPTLTASAAKLTGKGRILFVTDADGDDEIYVMEANGTDRHRLTNNQFDDFSPVWSPDGQSIAFVSDRTGNAEIFVMDADGTNITQFTFSDSGDYAPAWSPDGSQIAFVSDRDNGWEQSQIYLMNSDGSQQQRITHDDSDNFYPRWSADGQTIIFARELEFQEYQTTFIELNGDGVEEVLDLGINLGLEGVVESPNESMYVGGKELENGGYEIQLVSKDGTLIKSFPTQVIYPGSFEWITDSEFVFFSGYFNGSEDIFALEIATGEIFPITFSQHDEFISSLWP